MKIIILIRIFWTAGAQKIAIREAKELQLMGHDVELIFLRGRKLPEYNELLKGIKYTIISETGNSIFSPVYGYITHRFSPDRGNESRVDYNLIRTFPKYIKNRNIDYIICHDQFAGLAGYYSLKQLGIKYSVFIHERLTPSNNSILSRLWHKYENKILKNATLVFAITEKVAKNVADICHVKVVANYPGMDINKVNRVRDFNEKENALIAVSMWDSGRKPKLYLDVIEKIPDFVLYFVGNFRIKELEEEFKDEIIKRKLEKKVIMKQGVKESDLIELYQKSKFALRFGFEEFGLGSIMEPFQNVLPIITNSGLGASDLINMFSCGMVLEKIEFSTIIEFIRKYNEKSRYEAIQSNIRKVSEIYTWSKHVNLLMMPVLKK